MSPEDDKIEDDELPPEIDRGLGLAFGGARSASQIRGAGRSWRLDMDL